MPAPSRPSPDTGATPLVPSPVRREGERAERVDAASRVAGLWEAIRRTRAELEAREIREARVTSLFDTRIRPRERAFTDAVCRLTARLVTHHERTPLVTDERALLGLWIDENLQSLASHPFAPREDTDALSRRWRGLLDTARHPSDVPLAQLHARREGRDADAEEDAEEDTDRTAPGRARGRGGETAGGAGRAGDAGARHARSGGGSTGEEACERDARGEDAPDAAPGTDPGRVVSRLFRRLARALHPDLEPDETRRREKHRLMSDCLRARDERDIGTLLALHEAHVGELPEDLVDREPAALLRLLRDQLDELRGRLRRAVAGDALRRLVVARYGADDPLEIERRVAAHAGALDAETLRVASLEEEVDETAGLHRALLARREIELDRLAIDELTGLA